MKTFVYARISTEKQTLSQQMNSIENYLKLKGLKVDEMVSDEGVSGGVSYKERKLNQLLDDMNEGDALVVSEISRLGRSMSDLNKLVNDELKPRKLRLIVISIGLDLDCSNLKAIDEMVLFAFGFSAQIEKEMIQERTKNALESRKKQLAENGFFISKKGNRITKLGSNKEISEEAITAAAIAKKEKAMANESNKFFLRFMDNWESKNGKLEMPYSYKKLLPIVDELNALGQTTSTGMEYNVQRLRSMLTKRNNWLINE